MELPHPPETKPSKCKCYLLTVPNRWLCGGVAVNHHTLSDFRVRHAAGLDDLFTQVMTALVSQQLVTMERLSQSIPFQDL